VSAFGEGARLSDGLPLKLRAGHDPNQTLLHSSGMPAAGWVENIYRIGESLFADFKDIPKTIKEFIETNAYRNLSAGLIRDYLDPALNKTFDLVLGHVALLGDELPSIKGLGDFGALYKAHEEKDIEVILFSIKEGAIENEDVGVKEEEKQKKEAEEAKLQEEKMTKELEDKNAKLQTENDAKDAKIKEFEEAQKASDLKAKEVAVEAKKEKVKNFMETRIVRERILPVNAAMFSEMLLNADESVEVTFKEADGKESKITKYEETRRHIESLPKVVDLEEHSEGKDGESTPKVGDGVPAGTYNDNSEKLDKEATEYMAKNKDITYKEAIKAVALQHPEFIEAPVAV
jgi:hypothetical protein